MEHERILHILEYLTRFSNADKEVTLRDISAYLADQYGMQGVSAVTLRRDIDRLITAGHDVNIRRGPHNTAYYSLHAEHFSFNEIRFLVDSVCINRFLSDRQKKELIRKFEAFCSEEEVRLLVSRITLNSRTAPNADLLSNLDQVHRIIAEKRLILFEYGKYNTNGEICYYNKERKMLPCEVVYFSERFYLHCLDEETGAVRTYRVDRMRNISAGEKSTRKQQLPKAEGAVLDMFQPECYERITLRVKRFLLDDMMEQFGQYADVRKDDEPEWVQIRVRVGVSKGLFRWLMRYGADAVLLAPEPLRNRMQKQLLETVSLYDEK